MKAQDRFKFRAWYEKDKEMIYFDFDLINDESRAFYKESIEGSEIMQCTGLKNKNGKLIYEGDIFEAITGYQREVFEVFFSQGSFGAANIGNHGKHRFILHEYLSGNYHLKLEEIRIIGNIYETPELLGGEDD